MKLKGKSLIIAIAILLIIVGFMGGLNKLYAGQQDGDKDGLPDGVEKIYGTNPYAADSDGDGQNDKEDKYPLSLENPIAESSNKELPVKIKDARVEDNFNETHQDVPDHLQITLLNQGNEKINNFEVFYTITDKKTGEEEAYYQKLKLKISAGKEVTLHFDNQNKDKHFSGNVNGLYRTSANGLIFNISIHTPGYKPLVFKVEKDEGSAEVAD